MKNILEKHSLLQIGEHARTGESAGRHWNRQRVGVMGGEGGGSKASARR